ncbi:hypothetical protein GCM10009779_18660 [Polymorphospora rubra]|uniref:Uncharacterized protein n=1 Tax=Polymorphospora rubra TaxID=338584 RepID=A0A810MZN9_9ACTN|nr:hypothetical protein Prubr_24500 [Polymorphospora rubra]
MDQSETRSPAPAPCQAAFDGVTPLIRDGSSSPPWPSEGDTDADGTTSGEGDRVGAGVGVPDGDGPVGVGSAEVDAVGSGGPTVGDGAPVGPGDAVVGGPDAVGVAVVAGGSRSADPAWPAAAAEPASTAADRLANRTPVATSVLVGRR